MHGIYRAPAALRLPLQYCNGVQRCKCPAEDVFQPEYGVKSRLQGDLRRQYARKWPHDVPGGRGPRNGTVRTSKWRSWDWACRGVTSVPSSKPQASSCKHPPSPRLGRAGKHGRGDRHAYGWLQVVGRIDRPRAGARGRCGNLAVRRRQGCLCPLLTHASTASRRSQRPITISSPCSRSGTIDAYGCQRTHMRLSAGAWPTDHSRPSAVYAIRAAVIRAYACHSCSLASLCACLGDLSVLCGECVFEESSCGVGRCIFMKPVGAAAWREGAGGRGKKRA